MLILDSDQSFYFLHTPNSPFYHVSVNQSNHQWP